MHWIFTHVLLSRAAYGRSEINGQTQNKNSRTRRNRCSPRSVTASSCSLLSYTRRDRRRSASSYRNCFRCLMATDSNSVARLSTIFRTLILILWYLITMHSSLCSRNNIYFPSTNGYNPLYLMIGILKKPNLQQITWKVLRNGQYQFRRINTSVLHCSIKTTGQHNYRINLVKESIPVERHIGMGPLTNFIW